MASSIALKRLASSRMISNTSFSNIIHPKTLNITTPQSGLFKTLRDYHDKVEDDLDNKEQHTTEIDRPTLLSTGIFQSSNNLHLLFLYMPFSQSYRSFIYAWFFFPSSLSFSWGYSSSVQVMDLEPKKIPVFCLFFLASFRSRFPFCTQTQKCCSWFAHLFLLIIWHLFSLFSFLHYFQIYF